MAKTQSFKFEIEKFNGSNNFELWKTKKLYDMSNEDWNGIDEKAPSAIRLCLADDVLFNIVSETIAADL